MEIDVVKKQKNELIGFFTKNVPKMKDYLQ